MIITVVFNLSSSVCLVQFDLSASFPVHYIDRKWWHNMLFIKPVVVPNGSWPKRLPCYCKCRLPAFSVHACYCVSQLGSKLSVSQRKLICQRSTDLKNLFKKYIVIFIIIKESVLLIIVVATCNVLMAHQCSGPWYVVL